jgi:hypothetical protein
MAETLKAIAEFIGAVGFPAFVACVMMWQVWHMHEANHAEMNRIAAELAALRELVRLLVGELQG